MVKLYIDTKKMIFDEDSIEHEIILKVSDEKFYGYDILIELSDNDKFIKEALKRIHKENKENKEEIDYNEFVVREQQTWNSFPLYEIVDDKIVSFDYTKYQYFTDTDRRIALAFKINDLYNPSSEAKVLRETFKYIMDILQIEYPENFKKYNDKIKALIAKNPKEI